MLVLLIAWVSREGAKRPNVFLCELRIASEASKIRSRIFAKPNEHNLSSIEAKISSMFWQWKFVDPAERESIINESDLATFLEYWFPFDQIETARRLGMWCDGIPLLQMQQLNRKAFGVSGVGYFPYDLAAFETEWYFKNRRDSYPESIVLRIAHPSSKKVGSINQIFERRPTVNSDWMIAVELIN